MEIQSQEENQASDSGWLVVQTTWAARRDQTMIDIDPEGGWMDIPGRNVDHVKWAVGTDTRRIYLLYEKDRLDLHGENDMVRLNSHDILDMINVNGVDVHPIPTHIRPGDGTDPDDYILSQRVYENV